MVDRGIHSPLTSSLGRLFDAVAAVALGRRRVDYEAQAAIELEGVAIDERDQVDGYEVAMQGGCWATLDPARICVQPMWNELLRDLRAGVSKARISARFHSGICNGYARVAAAARVATGVNTVALSGGVMHNRRLARLLRSRLEADGFSVLQHAKVSPGDGGLSYGQAAVAAAILRDR
jgi:hydrogenase maturation protein HypF